MESVELGTMGHPYKSIDQAFIEVFNYWSNTTAVDILVRESTTNKVFFQSRPLIVNRNDNVRIMTYSTAGTDPVKATLNVINTETYLMMSNSKFSIMQGVNYNYTGAGSTILTGERSDINAQWYAFIILQSNFKMDGFIINNSLNLEDDDFAIVYPVSNLATKTLTIDNCDFKMYGTGMISFTSISFMSKGVTFDTENLVGGFIFLVSCNIASDVVTGEVVIDNLNFDGARSTLFKYGGVYMTGTQNFTIQNSYIGSYGFMFDAKQLTRADSPLNCQPTDGVKQIIKLDNNVYNMSTAYTGTPHHGFICSFLEWYPRTDMEMIFTNNVIMNVQESFYRVMLLDMNSATVSVTDNLFKDSTGAVDISQIKTTKSVEVLRNVFENISSTSQNILVITSAPMVTITDFTMNGANPAVVSSAILNLNMATNAVAVLNDIKFTNNIFLGTKAIVSQQLLSSFTLTNSSFTGDSIMQNTNYIDIQQASYVSITETDFLNITYQNTDDSGAYLIYIAKIQSILAGSNSVIQNILFNNIKTNAISFGGFSDSVASASGNLLIDQILFTNSTFNSPDSLVGKFALLRIF